MPYGLTYKEILEMVGKTVLDTGTARDIVRRSGYRPGGDGGLGAVPILSVTSPSCPKPPLDVYTNTMTPTERDAFYDTVELAETGDVGALDAMHDYLIDFGLEDTIVMDGVMPLLGYDYAGEVYTFTLDDTAGCPIEIDITPPANGFWEQYKDGDERFSSKDVFITPGQDSKFLAKGIQLHTGVASAQYPAARVFANDPNLPYYAGDGYPECTTGGVTPEIYTHSIDGVRILDEPKIFNVTGFRASLGSGGFSVVEPTITLTNDRLLDNPIAPTWETTHVGNGPFFGVITVDAAQNYDHEGPVTLTRAGAVADFFADTAWRACADDPAELVLSQDHFCVMQANQFPPEDTLTDTSTYRDWRITKEDAIGRRNIDWTINPSIDDTVERYTQAWDTFDVVAVRALTSTPPSVGTHLYPLDLENYITLWDVANATEARMSVVIKSATPGATLRPVWATSRENLIAGTWEYFCDGVACNAAGFYKSEWSAIPEDAIAAGDAYVGFVLAVGSEVENLVFGLAEIQIRH